MEIHHVNSIFYSTNYTVHYRIYNYRIYTWLLYVKPINYKISDTYI